MLIINVFVILLWGLLILLLLLSVLVCLVLIRLCRYLLLGVIGVGCCVWVWADCLLLGGYLLIVSIVVCCVGVLRWLLAYCWFGLLYDVFYSLWFIWVWTWSGSRFSL